MGACGSRSGSSKVYASTEDPLLAEVRARIAAYDDGGKGCPVGQLNAVLVDIGAEKLEAGALAAATKAVDPAGTGFMDADAFLGWFHSDPGDAAAAPPAEVHPSVAAGVKDEGAATGDEWTSIAVRRGRVVGFASDSRRTGVGSVSDVSI